MPLRVLTNRYRTLAYFEDRMCEKQKGRIALGPAAVAQASAKGGAGAWELRAGGGKKRTYKFKAGGADERSAWLAAVDAVIATRGAP